MATTSVADVTEYPLKSQSEPERKLSFLDAEVQDSLALFIERLREAEGDNLLSVVLFGSMARGDYDAESDTDVFILLREGNSFNKGLNISDIAYNAAFEVCYERGEVKPFVLISVLVETYESLSIERRGIPRWRWEPVLDEIRNDGIALYDTGAFARERICFE